MNILNDAISEAVATTLMNDLDKLEWFQACPDDIQKAIKDTINSETETIQDSTIVTLAGILTVIELVQQGQG
jgi:cell division protein ZapA (FtsZ GTPase activity inhibitor)